MWLEKFSLDLKGQQGTHTILLIQQHITLEINNKMKMRGLKKETSYDAIQVILMVFSKLPFHNLRVFLHQPMKTSHISRFACGTDN
jgi:hypothetical protein